MSLSVLFTPWYKRTPNRSGGNAEQAGSVERTPILNHESESIVRLVARSREQARSAGALAVLQAAHSIICAEVRPVYALEESTPAGHALDRAYGSCSQRLAILECVARALGVPTRVRVLMIDRSFWYARFPYIRFALPDSVMLTWPEFSLGQWLEASELFGQVGCSGGGAFTNSGAETLFEAAGRCAIDWDGHSENAAFHLSQFVRADYGYFANRDDAFRTLGQTLCAPSRWLADPLLRQIKAS